MTYQDIIKELEEISVSEYAGYSIPFVRSFFVPRVTTSIAKLASREHQIKNFIEVLNNYIANEQLPIDEKLSLIKFIDKLNLQHETLLVEKQKHLLTDIQKASRHLGKKMQSAFSEMK